MIDHAAAGLLKQLRDTAGHSPESLAADIKRQAKKEPWGRRGGVDAWTIRRIEDTGHVPGPRIRFVLASYFDQPIWYLPPGPLSGQSRQRTEAAV